MKKFAALTTTALLAATLLFGGTTAYAADGGTIYPEDEQFIKVLTFDSLTDYALDGEKYAFADGKSVKVYESGEFFEYAFESPIAMVDIEDGNVFALCGEKTYAVPSQTEAEHDFPSVPYPVACGQYIYSFNKSDELVAYNMEEVTTCSFGTGYKNIKSYNGKVYAVRENSFYEFDGENNSEILLEYADFSETRQISIGQASAALKSYSPVKFVKIESGSFMTAVDLEALGGQYFVPVRTIKTDEDTTALLLCYSGNSAIVSIGDSSYIVLKSKTSELEIEYSTQKPFEEAQMMNNMIYASPYVVSGTAYSTNAIGMIVTVLDRIELEGVLDTAFYEVEYTQGTTSVKGYVTEGFLTPYIAEDNKKPELKPDPDYSESSDTKTILIIFAVVVLVLAVFAYVAHISAGKKRRKNKKKDKADEE